jgi:hypothetical protein
MKKILCTMLIALVACAAFGQMDNRVYSKSLITTHVGSAAYTLRGALEAVNVVIPAGKTCTVAVASTQGTLFSKSDMTADTDGLFFPRIAVHSTAGVALTEVDTGSNTNSLYDKAVMAGAVTVTFTPKAATTETNTYSAELIYSK